MGGMYLAIGWFFSSVSVGHFFLFLCVSAYALLCVPAYALVKPGSRGLRSFCRSGISDVTHEKKEESTCDCTRKDGWIKGGKRRAAKITAEERSASASKAGLA